MVKPEHFCLSKLLLFLLFLLQFPEFQVPAQASDDHNLVFSSGRLPVPDLRFERAVLLLLILPFLPGFGYAFLLLLQFLLQVLGELLQILYVLH
jgi:hypothetical protein